MKKPQRIKFFRVLVVSLLIISNIMFSPSANAATKTIRDLHFSLTYPAVVKMPKGNCGSFKISYAKGLKLLADTNQDGTPDEYFPFQLFAGVLVDQDYAAGSHWTYDIPNVGVPLKNKGTATWKFCKQDWVDGTDRRVGLQPGTYEISFYAELRFEEIYKRGTIKFVK